jgi:HSP20 family protein
MHGVNIKEDDESYCIEVAAPGMKKSDFKVTLDNGLLSISTEQQHQHEEKDQESRYTRREFSYQSFSRSFQLPDTCEQEKIKARYRDGILYLTVPKKEEAKRKSPRLIEIS